MEPPSNLTYDAMFYEPSRASKTSELELRSNSQKHQTLHEIVDEGSEAGNEHTTGAGDAAGGAEARAEAHSERTRQPHGYPAPKHPVWNCFSHPNIVHEQMHAAHLRTLVQSRILVVCKFCNAELEKDTSFAKDAPEPVDEVQAMRAILHNMVQHLKEDCERCPENLRHEMLRWPLVPIPMGGEHHGDRDSPPPPLEAPTKPTVEKRRRF